MTRGIDDMIKDRTASHGAFQDTALLAQTLKASMRQTKNWEDLPAESREALEQAATHLSRILTGDAHAPEHWNKAAAVLRMRAVGIAEGGGIEGDMVEVARASALGALSRQGQTGRRTEQMVEASTRADLIERKIDRGIAGEITVSHETGGVDIRKLDQVMEAAKLMALAGSMVPLFLRENPGGCFGIIWKAVAWGMDPFAVASMAYEVENWKTKERTVAFMSQLTHAIIEARAPITKRLEVRYEGAGDERVCIVSGTFKGEDGPREHRSPRLGDRRPQPQKRTNRNGEDYETTAGSPLWQTKPDVQLFYDTSRDWARIYCPDIIMGIYSKEEMEAVCYGPVTPAAKQGTPSDDGGLSVRLTSSALARAGFPAEAAVAAIDEGMGKRDIGGGRLEHLSVDQVAGEAELSSPASGAGPEPESDPPATVAPENGEDAPRPSRARRSGRPSEPEARLV